MYAIFILMSIPPWAFLVTVNPILGLVGLAVQIIGLFGVLWFTLGRR